MNGNITDSMEEERTPTGSFLCGGVAERFKAPVLKTGDHFVVREFESRPLRHKSGEPISFHRSLKRSLG
jgi:hypothetical protein